MKVKKMINIKCVNCGEIIRMPVKNEPWQVKAWQKLKDTIVYNANANTWIWMSSVAVQLINLMQEIEKESNDDNT